MKTILSSLALLAAVAAAPALGLTACGSDDDDNTNPSPSPATDDSGASSSSSSGSITTGSAATSTLSVRIANLYAPQSVPGPTVDFITNDASDTSKYKVVLAGVAYGTLTAPVTLPHVDGNSALYVYLTGTFNPDAGFPTGWATRLDFADGTPADSAAVMFPDGTYQRGQESNLTVAAGKGAINFQEGNLPSPTPILAYIVDGACVDRNENGEPFANLDPGTHTVRFIDLAPHQCDPATSTDLHPQTSVTIVAGQVVELVAPGTTPTDPVLVIPDWK